MKYKPELGFLGNIQKVISEQNKTNNKVFNETTQRTQADTENRIAVEQSITELYLDNIQSQQQFTELQLQMLGG